MCREVEKIAMAERNEGRLEEKSILSAQSWRACLSLSMKQWKLLENAGIR